MHSSSTSTLVSSRSTTVGSRLEGKRISKMVTVTVVDVMSQESVVVGGLIMVVGVELSSSKNFFVVAKYRV